MPLIPNPQPRLFPALLLRLPKIDRQHREVEDVDDAVAVGVAAPHAAHSHGVIPHRQNHVGLGEWQRIKPFRIYSPIHGIKLKIREFEPKKHLMNPIGLGENTVCIYSPTHKR